MTGNGIETGMLKREKCSQFDDIHVALFLAGIHRVLAAGHDAISLPWNMDADDGDCRNSKWQAGNRK